MFCECQYCIRHLKRIKHDDNDNDEDYDDLRSRHSQCLEYRRNVKDIDHLKQVLYSRWDKISQKLSFMGVSVHQ